MGGRGYPCRLCAGLRGRAAGFPRGRPPGRGFARAWRVANLAAGQEETPGPGQGRGGYEHAGGGWFGYWGVCMTVTPGSWDPVACLPSTLALEDGVRYRNAFFWYNAASHHLLPAGLVTPPRVNSNSGPNDYSLMILYIHFGRFWPPFRPLGLLFAPFSGFGLSTFCSHVFRFYLSFPQRASYIHARNRKS